MASETNGDEDTRALEEGDRVALELDEGGRGEGPAVGVGGPGDPGVPEDREGLGDPVDVGNAGGPGEPGGPGFAGEAGGGLSQQQQPPGEPGPSGAAAPAGGDTDNGPQQFTLNVPFPSAVEAEIACRFLSPSRDCGAPLRKELSVNGTCVTIRMSAEDCEQLRNSVILLLDQLSIVLRILQRFEPPFFAKPQHGKRG